MFAFLERNDEKDIKPSSALLLEFNDFVRDQLLLYCECPFRYVKNKSSFFIVDLSLFLLFYQKQLSYLVQHAHIFF